MGSLFVGRENGKTSWHLSLDSFSLEGITYFVSTLTRIEILFVFKRKSDDQD